MKLKRAYAVDFMSFQRIDIDFQSLDGLILIEGRNFDDGVGSSGSGKTALMDLVSFVAFGESPRNIKVNDFINDKAKKGCFGGLELIMDNGSILIIERTRKPEDLNYQIDNNPPVRGSSIKETQKMIEELLKLDFNTFINSIYFTQNSNLNFISASDTEKRDILTRILDLSDFDKAYELADIELKQIEKDKERVVLEVANLNNIKLSVEKDLEILKQESENFEKEKEKEISNKNNQKLAIDEKIKDSDLIIESLNNKTFEVPKFEMEYPDLSKIEEEQNLLRSIEHEEIRLNIEKPDNSDIDSQISILNEKLLIKPKIELKLRSLEKSENEISFEIKQKNLLKEKIEETGSGICQSCFQEISEEHIKQETLNIDSSIKDLNDKLTQVMSDIEKVNSIFDKFSENELKIKQLDYEKNKRETEYSSLLKVLSDKQKLVQDQRLMNERKIMSLEKKKNEMIKEFSKAEKLHAISIRDMEIEKINVQNKIKSIKESIDLNKNKKIEIDKDVEEIKNKTNNIDNLIKIKKDEREKIMNEFSGRSRSLDSLEKKYETLSILKMSYKNIKYYIFESTIDELNNRINKYLDPLFEEDVSLKYEYVSGKNNDKLKFETKIVKNDADKSFESLSAGEACRMKLATNFALSDIVSMRKSNSFSLMMLDEVLAGLDENCIERVLSLLETLKTEKDKILIIDHFPAVKNLVENVIRVEKKDGISRLVE